MNICNNFSNFFSNLVNDPFGFGEIATGIEFDQTDELTRSIGAAFDRSVKDYNSAIDDEIPDLEEIEETVEKNKKNEALIKNILEDLTNGSFQLIEDPPDIDPNYLYEGQPLSTILIQKYIALINLNLSLAGQLSNFYYSNHLTKTDLGLAFLLNKVVIAAVSYKDENLYEVVETFLKNGANPNVIDHDGNSPLFTALNMTDSTTGAVGQVSTANCSPDEKLIEMLKTHGVIVDDKSRLLLTIPNATDSDIDKKKLLVDLDNIREISSLTNRLRLFSDHNNLP